VSDVALTLIHSLSLSALEGVVTVHHFFRHTGIQGKEAQGMVKVAA